VTELDVAHFGISWLLLRVNCTGGVSSAP